jgi:hypothetical protein
MKMLLAQAPVGGVDIRTAGNAGGAEGR